MPAMAGAVAEAQVSKGLCKLLQRAGSLGS
jgi:hypothetical protein